MMGSGVGALSALLRKSEGTSDQLTPKIPQYPGYFPVADRRYGARRRERTHSTGVAVRRLGLSASGRDP
jgi:hypothetical protein